ncbi:CapA family protein [Thalassobacillus hwangdonensis]|uniref:CapA family protein n=1 Tax=Thalassobacillus hwangdonensis TaxID=546108 RepID=A0ABW3KY29_9BACI
MKNTWVLLLFLLLFVVAGCSEAIGAGSDQTVDAKDDEIKNHEREAPDVTGENEEDKTAMEEEQPDEKEDEPKSTVFSFTGDVLFEWSTKKTVADKGYEYPFEHVREYFENDDFTFINLETPLTIRGEKEEKIYNFRSNPEAAKGLKHIGVDGAAMANNHILDYGTQGLLDTMFALDQEGISYIGAGENDTEAYQAFRTEINGKTYAFLNFSHVLPYVEWYALDSRPGVASGYQWERAIEIIKQTKEQSDYVFVQMHWGIEKEIQFNEDQQEYGRAMIDAGADAVIGSHPHVMQGFEMYNGKLIAYSLGNFLFPDYVKEETAQTGVLQVAINGDGELSYQIHPHLIKEDQIIPHPEAAGLKQRLMDRSYNVRINEKNEILPN